MSAQLIAVAALLLSRPTSADGGKQFSPDYCEFSVEFPTAYKPKQMTLGGVRGEGATARGSKTASFGAECWPYREQIPLDQFAKHMETQAQQRGFSVNSIIIDKNNAIADQIVLTGLVDVDGQTLHIKTISYFGKYTRLDLTTVDVEIASREQFAFRNSVRLKY